MPFKVFSLFFCSFVEKIDQFHDIKIFPLSCTFSEKQYHALQGEKGRRRGATGKNILLFFQTSYSFKELWRLQIKASFLFLLFLQIIDSNFKIQKRSLFQRVMVTVPYKMPVRISKDATGEVPVPLVANHFCVFCASYLQKFQFHGS